MPRATVEDPIKVFRFRVRVDGFVRATVTECTGLSRETEVVEYAEGGKNDTNQKSAGRTSFPNVTLKRGQIIGTPGENDFYDAADRVYKQGVVGAPDEYRFDMDIEQYNNRNLLVRTWRMENCWIRRVKHMGDLNGQSSDNSFEEIEIVHEGYDKA